MTRRPWTTPTPLTLVRNPSFPWAHASPDAIVGDDAGLDAKNAAWFRAEDFANGPPLGHQIQAQHYMAVTGRVRWHFAAVVGGNKLLVSTVDRDEAFIATLMATEEAWWQTHVVGRAPPEPDKSEATTRAIKRMFPRHAEGEVRALGDEFIEWRDRLDAAKADKSIAEDEIRELTNKITAAIGDAEFGLLPDGSGWKYRVEPRKEHVVKASEPRVLRYVKEIKR